MATPRQLTVWRIQYEELNALMVYTREQFMGWSEDLALLELQNPTVECRRYVADIKRKLLSDRGIIKNLPAVAVS
jgi:hypothetical protein